MTSTPQSLPEMTLSSPSDCIAAIPYLLGYQPTDTMVVIGTRHGRVMVTAAAPLPARHADITDFPVTPTSLSRSTIDAVILAGFGPASKVTRTVDHLRALCAKDEIAVLDALRITDGYWWSYLCIGDCCPADGTPVTDVPAVQAEFIATGATVEANRDDLVAISPAPVTDRAAVAAEFARLADNPGHYTSDAAISVVRDAVDQAAQGILPNLTATARLAFALTSTTAVTEALVLIDTHPLHATTQLWRWVTRHIEGPAQAHPACLLAFAVWRTGHGAIAAEAVRTALAVDPRNRLAATIHRILATAMPPSALPNLASTPPTDLIDTQP